MIHQAYIDACAKDGQKIERLIRAFYRGQPRRNVFLDGGAHNGYHALYAAHRFTDRVIGVEASPAIYVELIKQMSESPTTAAAEVLVVNAALGCRDRQGDTVQFFYSPSHPGRSTVNPKMWEKWSKGSVVYSAPILAPVVEIDDLRALYARGKQIDFIKLDLEGVEINALRGGQKTLILDRPNIVMEFGMKPNSEDLFGETLAGFRQLLQGWGYRAFAPWGEDVTDTLTEGYPFWYLFLLPDDDNLSGHRKLLKDCFAASQAEQPA